MQCIHINEEEFSLTIEPSNPAGFNSYPMDNSEQRNVAAFVYQEFTSLISYTHENPVIIHGITDPQKVYAAGDSAWREVLRQNDEVYLPIINKERSKELLHGKQLQTFLKNLSTFIYGLEYLRYDKIRSNWAPEGNREMPPLEYYDFLNRIDFSNLTDFLPYYPPFHILKNILLYFPIKIEPIGNTPVDQWQAQAKEKLGQVITNVPDNMVRLLSAASYRMQLDDNKPFTPAQIRNISAKVQEATPAYAVITPATVPIQPVKPKKAMILIGFTFLAFVACAAWILFLSPMLDDYKAKLDSMKHGDGQKSK